MHRDIHRSITSLLRFDGTPALRVIGPRVGLLTLSATLIALSSSGCGSDNAAQTTDVVLSTDATVSVTTATAPPVTTTTAPPGSGATTPPATGTTPAPPAPATPTGTTTAPADGGASPVAPAVPGGDEEGVRVPAAFTVSAGRVTPTQVTVPPFLRVELTLRSGDGDAHRVTLRTRAPASYDVPAGGTATQLVDGLPAGTYAILVDGRESGGSLRVADEAGP